MSFLSRLFKKSTKDSAKAFEADFCAWLSRISKEDTPSPQVIAYNIGLFESVDGFQAYLAGSTTFNEDDSDWACNEDFTPKERYFSIPAALSTKQDWSEIQTHVISATQCFLDSAEGTQSFFSQAQAITVGFDDGELFRIK